MVKSIQATLSSHALTHFKVKIEWDDTILATYTFVQSLVSSVMSKARLLRDI